MKELLQRELGFQILEVKKLSGYDKVNYLVKTAKYLHLNKKYLDDIPDPHDRNVVRYFFQQFEENVHPVLPELRKQVIYNDANEWNILVKENQVSGLIDFGDLAYSPLINEVAIALTYVCYDKENSLEWVPAFLKSYHVMLPLEEVELSILYYLIAARLCISVCNSAHAKNTSPANSYATVSDLRQRIENKTSFVLHEGQRRASSKSGEGGFEK